VRVTVAIAILGLASVAARAQVSYVPPSDASATRAAAFLRALVAKSPDHDGAPFRHHTIEDLDLDGRFEVVESVSELEERATGFLAAEYAPPCTWLRVYRDEPSGFVEATGHFRNFLVVRQYFYEHWLSYLRATGSDPQRVRSCAEENLARIKSLLEAKQKP
jgi:hypothetical protein